jgi:hypothetical protein
MFILGRRPQCAAYVMRDSHHPKLSGLHLRNRRRRFVLQQSMCATYRKCLLLAACLACIASCAVAAPAGATPALSFSGAATIDAGRSLQSVSCPSNGLCAAVDANGGVLISPNPTAGTSASYSRHEIDDGRSLKAISCATASFCAAVDEAGSVLLSTDPAAGQPTGSSATWSREEIDGGNVLDSISCASLTLCVAVDEKGSAFVSANPTAGVPAGSGATWNRLPIDTGTPLRSVSCASSTLCAAVDEEGNVLVAEPVSAAMAWRTRSIDPSQALSAVSCFSAVSCVALDSSGNALASGNATASLSAAAGAGSGATWSSTDFDPFGAPHALSCAAIGLCVAVDSGGDSFASDTATGAPPSWLGISGTPNDADGVSCTAEGLCVAVTGEGRAASTLVPAPTASTGAAQEVTHTTALLTGAVNPNDATLGTCRFEYGTSTTYGASIPCTANPSGGSSPQAVSAVATGLAANTTYYYRLIAASATGTGEGAGQTFKTLSQALVEPHPSIGGIPAVGQRLTCKSGVSSSSGATLAYAWLRNLSAIAGADGSTYAVSNADVSQHLQCRVTATNAEGSKSATSAFVTVPAGGLGTISETSVGTPRAGNAAVSVPLRCSPQAYGRCTIALHLTVLETLSGSRIVALAARTRRLSVTVGANTVHLKPGQQTTVTAALNATGRRLLAHAHRLAVRLSVSGTVVGAISASLRAATLTLGPPGKGAAHKTAKQARASATVRRASEAVRSLRIAPHIATRAAVRSLRIAPHIATRAAVRSLRIAPHIATRTARTSVQTVQTSVRATRASVRASVLAATPYMGWDTYFTFGGDYNEASVLEQASQLITRGLQRDGYKYVWLDVGWWQGTRNAAGQITVNPGQWPHGMAWLTRTLHAAGFHVGLYTDAGLVGCGGQGQGSYGHYQQDVNTFAAWGFDAVKVDFCGGIRLGLQPAAAYAAFHEAIVHNWSHRPILLSICDFLQPGQFASEDPALSNSAFASYTFGPSDGNSWRTDTDVGTPGNVPFNQVLRNLDADAAAPQAAGPGHWNDPDYLGPDQGMSAAQFRTQFSMWAMLAAPLMVSADLISLTRTSAATISNREVIAIDQDPAGLQARLLASSGNGEVWVKALSDGSRAVALLNRGAGTLRIATSAAAVGMPAAGGYLVRNVWTGAVNRVGSSASIAASVPGESTVLLRISTR